MIARTFGNDWEMMNKVEAISQSEKLNDVKEALAKVGLIGLNVVNITGRGAQRGVTSSGSPGVGRYEIDMPPKVKLELVVHDDATQKAVDTIIKHTRTGDISDGKIFSFPVSNAIKVRTGET